jgi:hypothetical protein
VIVSYTITVDAALCHRNSDHGLTSVNARPPGYGETIRAGQAWSAPFSAVGSDPLLPICSPMFRRTPGTAVGVIATSAGCDIAMGRPLTFPMASQAARIPTCKSPARQSASDGYAPPAPAHIRQV